MQHGQKELGILKTNATNIAAHKTRHTADIRDLASGLETTRRALDPKVLAEHVSNHIDAFLGEQVELLAKAVTINHKAAKQTIELAAKLSTATAQAETANNGLRKIAARIEEHAERSKWDWAVLAAGMVVAALLAGGGAYFCAKRPDRRR